MLYLGDSDDNFPQSNSPEYPGSDRIVRYWWCSVYPVGSPQSTGIVDEMLKGNAVERGTVMKFAMAMPQGERARAEAIVDRAVVGKVDDSLLYVAAVAYSRLAAYPKAVKTADAAIAQIDARLADPQYAPLRELIEKNRANFVKVRDEAAKSLLRA